MTVSPVLLREHYKLIEWLTYESLQPHRHKRYDDRTPNTEKGANKKSPEMEGIILIPSHTFCARYEYLIGLEGDKD